MVSAVSLSLMLRQSNLPEPLRLNAIQLLPSHDNQMLKTEVRFTSSGDRFSWRVKTPELELRAQGQLQLQKHSCCARVLRLGVERSEVRLRPSAKSNDDSKASAAAKFESAALDSVGLDAAALDSAVVDAGVSDSAAFVTLWSNLPAPIARDLLNTLSPGYHWHLVKRGACWESRDSFWRLCPTATAGEHLSIAKPINS